MPPAAKRNQVAILYDCKTQSSLPKKALLKIALVNECSNSNDDIRLILLNSEKETEKNDKTYLNAEIGGWNTKDIYEALKNTPSADGNWLMSLRFGLQVLSEGFMNGKNVINRQLLFLTDFNSQLESTEDETEALCEEVIKLINANNFYVYFVGAPIDPPPNMIKNVRELEQWAKNIKVPKDNPNLVLAKRIVTKTESSILCSAEIGAHLFLSYQDPKGMQPWAVPLTIGTQLPLETSTIRLLKYEDLLKESSPGQSYSRNKTFTDAEDQSVDVAPDDLVRGVLLHSKFVPIEDEKKFKVDSIRGFTLFGFTDSKEIPEAVMTGPSYIVITKDAESPHSKLLHSLIDTLSKKKMYGLATRVYNKGSNPQYMVLIPKSNKTSKYFLAAFLQYYNKLNPTYAERDVKEAEKGEIIPELYSFLDSSDIGKEGCRIKMPLAPNMMIDITSWKMLNHLGDDYLNESLMLSDVDKYVDPLLESDLPSDVKMVWPERKIEAKTYGKVDDGNASNEEDSDFEFC